MCFAPSTLSAGGPNQNTSRIQCSYNEGEAAFNTADTAADTADDTAFQATVHRRSRKHEDAFKLHYEALVRTLSYHAP